MTQRFPTLAENAWTRYGLFALLYVAQGIPEGLVFIAIPAYLAAQGVAAAPIAGLISIATLPWALKLFYGPVMDRWSFLPMGRRRPWVLFGQCGLTLSFAALAFVGDPVENLSLLTAGFFVVGFFGAFQDVGTDGMAIDVVPVEQQARANGIMWGSKALGLAGAAAVGSWLINAAGFGVAILTLAGLVAAIMGLVMLVRERPGERLLPWTEGEASPAAEAMQLDGWRDIFRSLLQAFVLPVSLVASVVGFLLSLSRGFTGALLPIFTVQDLGWGDTTFSQLYATAGLMAGVLGMALGGVVTDRVGKRRALIGFIAALALVQLTMGLWVLSGVTSPQATAYIYGLVAFEVLASIAFFATAMALCWERVSATQFALYMAIGNFGLAGGAALFGALASRLDYGPLFFLLVGLAVLILLLLPFVRIDRQLGRLAVLDASKAADATAELA